MQKIPELLAPAGNFEKLKVAFHYGADAVYIGAKSFSLRAGADNFDADEMTKAFKYAHERGKKVYVAVNIFAHNEDIDKIAEFFDFLGRSGADAAIISDPGVLSLAKRHAPNLSLTLSTQANCTNYQSAIFWQDNGISRIILARELSYVEINEINSKLPEGLETEIFVHGAVCMSYSGRCILSNYLNHRDANRGSCSHPCRWNYSLQEESRPGEYFPVYEDERSTSIFSSKDLCLIEYIPQIIDSGVSSIKIEGRMKSAYYVAATVSAYRNALDQYLSSENSPECSEKLKKELEKVNHRTYFPGFFDPEYKDTKQLYTENSYTKNYEYLGLVMKYDTENSMALVQQQNKICMGDVVEIIQPDKDFFIQTITSIYDEELQTIDSAPHSKQLIWMHVEQEVKQYDIIRKAL